ncbi:hypothetical protein BK133_11980 [Paenibacillus sp. FSL H8-0548]|uniref:hypothetical protein n=1 Tax=Paenibacillus sp. FSL H8-0548 TaxID=1920422 RepID=UPI00096BD673|nr:hypothetical protein [Paenibacillus sp. FSL H8-0548]OMF34718.1 hypothetical protein BK133_11980 [Paenibacillus sp. FSL H8-0548]
MPDFLENMLGLALLAGQYVFGAVAIYSLLQLWPQRPARWRHLALLSWRTKRVPERWLRWFRISRQQPSFMERELLLAGCGVTIDAAWYVLVRRFLFSAVYVLLALVAACHKFISAYIPISYAGAVLTILLLMLYIDLMWLRSIRTVRALQITKEIFVISKQLLYMSESSLHIHAKLLRCIPFTRVMRDDLDWLLAEWYHDAGSALQRFKQRLGTEEGLSFVETLDALRLHESPEYYELLRVRIADYKEKIELAKESRKESTSYFLFVIAGIPILYTFQIFIYPWVREGQKLFQSLS